MSVADYGKEGRTGLSYRLFCCNFSKISDKLCHQIMGSSFWDSLLGINILIAVLLIYWKIARRGIPDVMM